MNSLFEDSFLPGFGMTERSASNLYETAESFVLQLPIAGVKPEEVEIAVQQSTVNVKWATQVTVPANATTHWSGFAEGQYQQSFTLPAPINADQAEASYENGVLTLTLPKAEHAKARQVKVQTKMPAFS
jgi:HSP20 family protein